jgi:hypothetical protein
MAGKIIIYFLVLCGTVAVSWRFKIEYSFADFKAFIEVLLNVSGAVFTLMGIWIAFLYPNALSRIVDPNRIEIADFSENLQDSKRLTAIVGSVLISAIVVLSVLSMMLLKLFFINSGFLLEHKSEVKHIVLGASTTLFLLQAEAVVGVIMANIMFINDLHRKRAIKQMESEY